MPSLSTLPRDLRLFAKYHLKRRVYDHPARETELGVHSLGFDLDAYADELRAFAPTFDVETLAEINYKGRKHPLLQVVSPSAAQRTVLVLAGVHGNEHAGLLAVPPILARYAEEQPDVRLVVITPVNPVGAAELSRYNGDGYDINRDFVRFDTIEADVVRAVVDRQRPDFIVSLHEGPQDASFMFANGHVERQLADRLLAALRDGGTSLATRDYFGLKLEPPGYSPATPITRFLGAAWARTLAMKTTGGFAEDRGIPELTLESSWREADSEARIRPHVDLVIALCAALSGS